MDKWVRRITCSALDIINKLEPQEIQDLMSYFDELAKMHDGVKGEYRSSCPRYTQEYKNGKVIEIHLYDKSEIMHIDSGN